MSGKPRPGSGRSNYRNLYRNDFVCYSNRNCDRAAHMTKQGLTEPWYIRGNIVDQTVDGQCQAMEYEQFPWQGVCSYLEIHNPGIYTFATPCDCGSERMETPDLNERLCVWKGERCGGDIGSESYSPPPPKPPGGFSSPPPPPSPRPSPPPPPSPPMGPLGGGAVFSIVLTVLSVIGIGGYAGWTALRASAPIEPSMTTPLVALTLSEANG